MQPDKCIAIIINMSNNTLTDKMSIKSGLKLNQSFYGKTESNATIFSVELPKNDATAVELLKSRDK